MQPTAPLGRAVHAAGALATGWMAESGARSSGPRSEQVGAFGALVSDLLDLEDR
ncbi:hypothetical protein ACICHK_01645 [Streptomyces sp. AHU1]|uniref:hypothetical protein n=1 Tax=Streptomyces sp. AHU1 TaxID=3377215 RepID=UPI003877E196